MKTLTLQTLLTAGSLAVLCLGASPTLAQTTTDHAAITVAQAGSAAAVALSEGEVRKIDTEQGKVTLKHGPIANLDMPGMTMVFTVRDKHLLDGVKPGDKVQFRAVDDHGKMIVTELQAAR